jgi:hypothetical protein
VDAWIARTHSVIYTPGGGVRVSTLPIRACTGWCIGPPYPNSTVVSHLRGTTSSGHGLWTHWDLNPGPPPCKGGALPLSYGPVRRTVSALVVHGCPVGFVCPSASVVGLTERQVPVCGGDPAADSPTATLLRLKPPCETQIRPSYDGLIRTSLGCFDGRCVQGAGTYSPRATDARLLPNPAS